MSQFFYGTKKCCCSKDDSLGSDCKKINVNITSSGSLAGKFLFIHRKDCHLIALLLLNYSGVVLIKSCKTCCSVDQLGVSAGLNLAPEPYFWFTAWQACNVNVAYRYVTCCSTEQGCDVKVIVPSFIYSLFFLQEKKKCHLWPFFSVCLFFCCYEGKY